MKQELKELDKFENLDPQMIKMVNKRVNKGTTVEKLMNEFPLTQRQAEVFIFGVEFKPVEPILGHKTEPYYNKERDMTFLGDYSSLQLRGSEALILNKL